MLTFEALNSIDMFAFCLMAGNQTIFGWCSIFHIWPWKIKVKVMAKVKSDSKICGLGLNRYVCFLFCDYWTIVGWDIANSISNLENSRSRSCRKSTKIYQGNLWVRAINPARNEQVCGRWRKYQYKNIKSSPVYRGDLTRNCIGDLLGYPWPSLQKYEQPVPRLNIKGCLLAQDRWNFIKYTYGQADIIRHLSGGLSDNAEAQI